MGAIVGALILVGGGFAYLIYKKQNYTTTGIGNSTVGVTGYQSSPIPPINFPPPPDPLSGEVSGGFAAASSFVSSAQSGALGVGLAASKAIPIVGSVISAAQAIVGPLLAAHKKRMAGATSETNAAVTMVPTVDSFIQQIATLYNTRQISAADAANALAQFDQAMYTRMRGLAVGPGTAWNDAAGMAGKCDKTCTAGCCLYFGDLGPPVSLMRYVLGDNGGRWGAGDPRLSGRTITVPKVYPGKYSQYSRESYKITLS